jgi:hypothetical protein
MHMDWGYKMQRQDRTVKISKINKKAYCQAEHINEKPRMSLLASEHVRNTTIHHVDPVSVRYFETLNIAQILYMNNIRIALAPAVAEATQDTLRVELRIDFRSWTTAQHILSLHIATDCVKKFVFEHGHAATEGDDSEGDDPCVPREAILAIQGR